MGAAPITVEVSVRLRWWVRPFMAALMVAASLGIRPNADRAARLISNRGLVIKTSAR